MANWQTLARRAARQVGVDPNVFVRLVRQESTGDPTALSPKGAIGYTQLMPDTARGLGVNPRDPWQNLLGGARYLKQQLHTFGRLDLALAAYNAGPGAVSRYGGIPPYAETRHYVNTILGGANPTTTRPRGGGRTTAPPSPAGTTTTGTTTGPRGLTADPGSSGDVSALLSLLSQQQRPAPSSMGLQAPAFSARPTLPAGYQAPASGGGPEPKPDINQLLALVRTQGGGDVAVPGSGGTPGATGQPVTSGPVTTGPATAPRTGTGGYPLTRHGKVIGVPHQGTHTLGNWQSDNAVDISVPVGTPVEAVTGGRIVKVRYGGPPSSQFGGYQVTIEGPRGGLFYTHLSKARVRAGQTIKRGTILGLSGAANGVPHLHFGVQNGDPRTYLGR